MSYIADIRDLHARIHELVRQDPLSRLLNRAAFEEDSELKQPDPEMAVLLADINNFKRFNTLGHHVGDMVITKVSELLTASAGAGECRIYRYGGDEFVLVVKSPEAMKRVEERLAATFGGTGVELQLPLEQEGLRLSLSVGVAQLHEKEYSLALALARADLAQGVAKQRGKGRYSLVAWESGLSLEATHLVRQRCTGCGSAVAVEVAPGRLGGMGKAPPCPVCGAGLTELAV
jgi:diguanylate cyclase (GGDEF)-like protein